MNIDTIIVGVSFIVAVTNTVATAMVYLRYVHSARNIICMLRADESGEIEIYDPFSSKK